MRFKTGDYVDIALVDVRGFIIKINYAQNYCEVYDVNNIHFVNIRISEIKLRSAICPEYLK